MARKAAGREGGPRQNDERYFWEALSAEGRARFPGGGCWVWGSGVSACTGVSWIGW
jgi:hypothetical protein